VGRELLQAAQPGATWQAPAREPPVGFLPAHPLKAAYLGGPPGCQVRHPSRQHEAGEAREACQRLSGLAVLIMSSTSATGHTRGS